MKKYIIAGVLVVAFVAYVIFANTNKSAAPMTAENNPSGGTPAAGSSSTTGGDNGTPPTGAGTGGASTYKDGIYTGTVADAFYGNLQVAVTISGGKITDVTFPQYPNEAGHTAELSQMVMPELKAEAIAAQSANVQIISGATQDTQAFQQSLASALTQA
jgi:uncharacterized protein with FMN-binding domain